MVSVSPNTIRIRTTKPRTNITSAKEQKHGEYNDPFFDRKVENATEGLKSDCYRQFYKIQYDNVLTIANYILSMKLQTGIVKIYSCILYLDSYRTNQKSSCV
jgi:hypothetical protein